MVYLSNKEVNLYIKSNNWKSLISPPTSLTYLSSLISLLKTHPIITRPSFLILKYYCYNFNAFSAYTYISKGKENTIQIGNNWQIKGNSIILFIHACWGNNQKPAPKPTI